MAKGGYLGGSTVIGPYSGWFSRSETGPQLTAEEKMQNQIEWASREKWATAEKPRKGQADQSKDERKRTKKLEQEKQRKAKVRELQEESARSNRYPAYLELRAARKKKEEDRIARVVVEGRNPRKRGRGTES